MLTNEGARFFNVGSKLVATEFAMHGEAQSGCRMGNDFTLLGIGEIPITVEVGWNQSLARSATNFFDHQSNFSQPILRYSQRGTEHF